MELKQVPIRRASLSQEELEARQQTASIPQVRHFAGLQSVDTPCLPAQRSTRPNTATSSALQNANDDDDRLYQTRTHTSVRVYHRPQKPASVSNSPSTRVTEEIPQRGISIQRFLLACFCILIAALLMAMLINLYVAPAIGRWNDDRIYGYPRITKATANVGHGDKQHPLSQFIAVNTNGVIDVIELSYGNQNQKTAHVYFIATLTGASADLVPVTSLSFQDENGDGKPDLAIVVGNTLYILYNNGTEFTFHP